MLVYMLLNTVTEKAYVGATDKPLEERWARHVKDAEHGSMWKLHVAMRQWQPELWERVVLQLCYTVEELSAAEERWKHDTDVMDPAVGYNENMGPYDITVSTGKRGGDPLTIGGSRPGSPLAGLDREQRREFFREAGRRGAAVARART